MRQHGEAGALLTGVWAAALLLVHHEQAVEVHFSVYRLCSEQNQQSREEEKRNGQKTVTEEKKSRKCSNTKHNKVTLFLQENTQIRRCVERTEMNHENRGGACWQTGRSENVRVSGP